MPEACMFDIMTLPEEDLQKVLSKASTRSLAKLATAYPRAVGRPFLEILKKCLSAPTFEFLEEEMVVMRIPSYPEIRNAELELMKIIHEENLIDHLSSSQSAKLPLQ